MVTTERKDHCRTFLEGHSGAELARFDGVVAVGGDGLFQEVLNAVLTLRRGPICSRAPAPNQSLLAFDCPVERQGLRQLLY